MSEYANNCGGIITMLPSRLTESEAKEFRKAFSETFGNAMSLPRTAVPFDVLFFPTADSAIDMTE